MNIDEMYVLVWLILKVCLLILVVFNFAILIKLNTRTKIFIKNIEKHMEKQNDLNVKIKYTLQQYNQRQQRQLGQAGQLRQQRTEEKIDMSLLHPDTQKFIQDSVNEGINHSSDVVVGTEVEEVAGELVREPPYDSF